MHKILAERIGIASLLLLGLFSFAGWYAFFHQSFAAYISGTQSILLGFSLAGTFFFLGALVWDTRSELICGSLLPFVPALFFFREPAVAIAIVPAFLLTLLAIHGIQAEKRERIRFQYFKTAQAGQFFFILALALVVATASFFIVSRASWEELVSRFRLGEGAATVLLKGASYWQPELGQVQNNQVSVKTYLLDLAREKVVSRTLPTDSSEPASESVRPFAFDLDLVPGLERELSDNGITLEQVLGGGEAERRYLDLGEERLGMLSGESVRDGDPMDLVFASVLRRQITNAFSGTEGFANLSAQTLPFALSVVLFLALLSIGSVLGYLWIALGYLVFLYLLKTDQLEIVTHREPVDELVSADH